jgi:hypothetical protein
MHRTKQLRLEPPTVACASPRLSNRVFFGAQSATNDYVCHVRSFVQHSPFALSLPKAFKSHRIALQTFVTDFQHSTRSTRHCSIEAFGGAPQHIPYPREHPMRASNVCISWNASANPVKNDTATSTSDGFPHDPTSIGFGYLALNRMRYVSHFSLNCVSRKPKQDSIWLVPDATPQRTRPPCGAAHHSACSAASGATMGGLREGGAWCRTGTTRTASTRT